jgi:hypothetical protein
MGFGAVAKCNIGARIIGNLMTQQLDQFWSLAKQNELL